MMATAENHHIFICIFIIKFLLLGTTLLHMYNVHISELLSSVRCFSLDHKWLTFNLLTALFICLHNKITTIKLRQLLADTIQNKKSIVKVLSFIPVFHTRQNILKFWFLFILEMADYIQNQIPVHNICASFCTLFIQCDRKNKFSFTYFLGFVF